MHGVDQGLLSTNSIFFKGISYANPEISVFINDIFNHCLTDGVYPDAFKVAEVIPILKKGDHKKKNTNYRPLSILSQSNKILVKLLYNRSYSYLTRFNFLSGRQFGFRKTSLTTLQSIKYTTIYLAKSIKTSLAAAFFLHSSKALDTVNHKILLGSLKNYSDFEALH